MVWTRTADEAADTLLIGALVMEKQMCGRRGRESRVVPHNPGELIIIGHADKCKMEIRPHGWVMVKQMDMHVGGYGNAIMIGSENRNQVKRVSLGDDIRQKC